MTSITNMNWADWTGRLLHPTLADPRIFLLLAALAAGLTVYFLSQGFRPYIVSRPSRALNDYLTAGQENDDDKPEHVLHPKAITLLRLGLPPNPAYYDAILYGAAGLVALVALLLGYPLVLVAGLGAIVYVVVKSYLDSQWRKFRYEIEKELPIFIARLSGVLLTSEAIGQSLEDTAVTFPDNSPLRLWVERLIKGYRAGGVAFFRSAQDEANRLSPSLGVVVFQLRRLTETGGGGYIKAFATIADEVSMELEARAIALSKANSARDNVHFLLGLLALTLFAYMTNGELRAGLSSPLIQMLMLVALGIVAFGYKLMTDMIDSAIA